MPIPHTALPSASESGFEWIDPSTVLAYKEALPPPFASLEGQEKPGPVDKKSKNTVGSAFSKILKIKSERKRSSPPTGGETKYPINTSKYE
jgi:hypothetical protein